MNDTVRKVIGDAAKLLTFRLSREDLSNFSIAHLWFGLLCTWLVGIGRWWDDPGANLLQHLGIGSILYIFVLSAVLWLVTKPMMPANWSYVGVLTFVSLTSPPAILYAIPVERFMSLESARVLNALFLGVVAAWRVALLFFYMRTHGRLKILAVISASLLPLMAIIVTLTILNLERAVFNIMSGMRENGTSSDAAYSVLFALTILSVYLIIPVFVAYIVAIVLGGRRKDR